MKLCILNALVLLETLLRALVNKTNSFGFMCYVLNILLVKSILKTTKYNLLFLSFALS